MKTKRQNTIPANKFEGHLYACGHRIAFRYWDFEAEVTPELESRLQEDAEERSRELIAEDYTSGELNCLFIGDHRGEETEEEIRGWWEIVG